MATNGTGLAAIEKKKAAAKGGGGSGSGASLAEMEPDLQDMQGNQFMADMLKGPNQGTQKDESEVSQKLPASVRWRMLASNEVRVLANLIYANATPSEMVTKEMLAIGSVFYNRRNMSGTSAANAQEFGPPSFEAQAFNLQRTMPPWYDQGRYLNFNGAARFDESMKSSLDVKSAANAVEAAEQLVSGVTPFGRKFTHMDISGQSPNPERTDHNSKVQYGRFYFWSMTSDAMKADQDTGTETAATLNTGSDSSEPVV